MRISKLVLLIGLPAVLSLIPFTAADARQTGLYLGGAWGAYSINESALDDHDDLLKAYLGGQFNHWFGIEGSWVDFNRLDNGAGDTFEADGRLGRPPVPVLTARAGGSFAGKTSSTARDNPGNL